MGLVGSKQLYIPNDDDEDDLFDDEFTERDNDNLEKPCFNPMLFCPPPSQQRKSLLGARNDTLGTPLMTPPMTKRRRHDLIEEARENPVYSSLYEGLEKETDIFLPLSYHQQQQQQQQQQNGNFGVHIYEGKNAERMMHKKYELLEVLGVGSTSTCHRCQARSTGLQYACKIIDKKLIASRFQSKNGNPRDAEESTRKMMQQFETEILALQKLQHPNIIQLHNVFSTPQESKLYIVMELMMGGELFDYVVQKGTLTEQEASLCVRQVTSALVYMHSQHVIHRDLKPENLLLQHYPKHALDLQVKVIDFGLSKCLSSATYQQQQATASSFLGTRGYLAPEMIQRQEYTTQVDVWSLGIIVFVLLCGCLPFGDDDDYYHSSIMAGTTTNPASPPLLATKFKLKFPRWAKNLSPSAKDLLERLLDVDPHSRISANEALVHAWVKGETANHQSMLHSPKRIKTVGNTNHNTPPPSSSSKAHNNGSHHRRNQHPHSHPRHRRQRSKDFMFVSHNNPTTTGSNSSNNTSTTGTAAFVPPRTLVRKSSI